METIFNVDVGEVFHWLASKYFRLCRSSGKVETISYLGTSTTIENVLILKNMRPFLAHKPGWSDMI